VITTYYQSGFYMQISDTARPGSMTSNNGMTYTAKSITFSIDLKATASSAVVDTQSVRFLSDSSAILAEARYDASTGQMNFSVGPTTFSPMAAAVGSFHSVTFTVKDDGKASWAVDGNATAPVDFGNPIVSMELDVDYASEAGAAPDFFFGNMLVTNP